MIAIKCLNFGTLQLVMLLWSYFTVVFTDPGSVPEHFRRELGGGESLEAGTSTDQGAFGSIGYCPKCRNVKPPRCHHCSVCKKKSDFLMLNVQRNL